MEQKHYFLLLRHALGFTSLTGQDAQWLEHTDWMRVLSFANKQALVGLMFEGIKQLPDQLTPKGRGLLDWVAQSEAIRRQNIRLNQATAQVYNQICAQGFPCCILKGQGNALLYRDTHSRTPGDIDVWVGGRMEELRNGRIEEGRHNNGARAITRQELYDLALALAGGDASRLDVSYHHIGLCIDGVEVELHPTPGVLAAPRHDRRLQQWLQACAGEQFTHKVELPDGAGSVAVPTREFNLVYQLLHLYHHYFFEGIGLRQFVDYALVMGCGSRKTLLTEDGRESTDGIAREERMENSSLAHREARIATLRHLGLYSFCGAVMWVLGEVLGVPAETMIVPADERRGRLLLHDILRGGNFGHYDHRFAHNALGHNVQRIQRDLTNLRFYPHEALAEPWFRLWHWWWRRKHGK